MDEVISDESEVRDVLAKDRVVPWKLREEVLDPFFCWRVELRLIIEETNYELAQQFLNPEDDLEVDEGRVARSSWHNSNEGLDSFVWEG